MVIVMLSVAVAERVGGGGKGNRSWTRTRNRKVQPDEQPSSVLHVKNVTVKC